MVGFLEERKPFRRRTQANQPANHDLYHGPVVDDDGYPGFVTACKTITKAIDDLPSVIYLCPDTGEVLVDEPDDADLNDWFVIEKLQLLRELVGKELAPYMR